MAQLFAPTTDTLPGIVTDQEEIFESEPVSDDSMNELDLMTEAPNEAINVIEVPIRQAFSYFAERENEIAKFYVQSHGEYKIRGEPENETDIEKYHRLCSEVNDLLTKFQTDVTTKSELSAIGALNNEALSNNLEVLAKQLKSLEFAANEEGLAPSQFGLNNVKSKLEKLGQKIVGTDDAVEAAGKCAVEAANVVKLSAIERRINFLETLLGQNSDKTQDLFKNTKCESLMDVADTLASWQAMFKPDSVQRLSRELDYLNQRFDKINDQASNSDDKLDLRAKARLEHLCNLATATDKYRAMVPTIIHRLKAMEELQQRAAQVSTTVNYLERVQAQIIDSLQSNKDEIGSLNEMFAKNIELIKEYSKDIDVRIARIENKDD